MRQHRQQKWPCCGSSESFRSHLLAVAAEDHLDVPGRAEDDLVRVRVRIGVREKVKVRVIEADRQDEG